MFLPDLLLISQTNRHHTFFILKRVYSNNIIFFGLAILNTTHNYNNRNQLFSTTSQAAQFTAIEIILLRSSLASQYFFLSSTFQLCLHILNKSLFLLITITTSLFHFVLEYLSLSRCNHKLLWMHLLSFLVKHRIVIPILFFVNIFSKHLLLHFRLLLSTFPISF